MCDRKVLCAYLSYASCLCDIMLWVILDRSGRPNDLWGRKAQPDQTGRSNNIWGWKAQPDRTRGSNELDRTRGTNELDRTRGSNELDRTRGSNELRDWRVLLRHMGRRVLQSIASSGEFFVCGILGKSLSIHAYRVMCYVFQVLPRIARRHRCDCTHTLDIELWLWILDLNNCVEKVRVVFEN